MKEVIINISLVIEYYGYVSVDVLKETIEMLNNKEDGNVVSGFLLNDKQYNDVTDATLEQIVIDWKDWYLNTRGFEVDINPTTTTTTTLPDTEEPEDAILPVPPANASEWLSLIDNAHHNFTNGFTE